MSEKILIISPAWIGDAVMAQCLFKLIKRNDPNAIIDVLAPAWTFSLLRCMPEVSNVFEIPIKHGELQLSKRKEIGEQLKKNYYDRAIVLPNSFKSALIPWFAKIPIRTGWLGEFRFHLLNDVRYLDKKRYPLMIEQYMALGVPKNSPLPIPYLYPKFLVTPASQEKTLAKINPKFNGRKVLGIAPGGAFGPSKRWPPEYFAEVANYHLDQGWDVWVFGSNEDIPITDVINQATNNRCSVVAGKTELADTIDLVSLTSALITNDSGLMHIASALKKPLIAIYGSTSPKFTPPLADTSKILKLDLVCQPCFKRECPLGHHKCMRDLVPKKAIDIAKQWIAS